MKGMQRENGLSAQGRHRESFNDGGILLLKILIYKAAHPFPSLQGLVLSH